MKTKPRSLIIDDEADICRLLGYILARRGIESECAHTIRDGRSLLHKKYFHFVFLDNKLPDGTGADIVPYLKQEFTGMKIVMITALPNTASPGSLSRMGIDWFLPKPLHADSINDVLDQLTPADPLQTPEDDPASRFHISFYLHREKVDADVKKSVAGRRTDYTVHPRPDSIARRFGSEVTLFFEDENFSVDQSGDEGFEEYINAIANAIRDRD